MSIIAKYKFDSSIYADLIPEFNAEFTSDLYTVTDEVDSENSNHIIRTIESDSLPTLMRFGSELTNDEYVEGDELSLLEVYDIDTRGLTSGYRMFKYCTNLTKINCNWNTSNVTDMFAMFNQCHNLTTLDVSNFDTSNVTTMQSMFYNCQSLTTLDVSKWDTSKVTNMEAMFANNNLTSLDLSNFDIVIVTNIKNMFAYDYKLANLNLSNWNINENVQSITGLFNSNINLNSVIMNNSDYNSVNKIIAQLPTRITLGYMYISRDIINDVNISDAESKMWKILPLGGRVKNVYIHGNNITNMITKQNKKIKGIYLGDTPLL